MLTTHPQRRRALSGVFRAKTPATPLPSPPPARPFV
ncbi:hypothetical protein E2C01_049064 [Portunus trituberculatus]|uniref:Uncharacterized protein n=1 Tax=Portunus trituberculatus TaxID=210409 RepID=A0A5B7GCY0_PORTR|nr:hypothetical protein [Portunus trituberculatus]